RAYQDKSPLRYSTPSARPRPARSNDFTVAIVSPSSRVCGAIRGISAQRARREPHARSATAIRSARASVQLFAPWPSIARSDQAAWCLGDGVRRASAVALSALSVPVVSADLAPFFLPRMQIGRAHL